MFWKHSCYQTDTDRFQMLGFGLQADFKIDLQIDPHIGPYEAQRV